MFWILRVLNQDHLDPLHIDEDNSQGLDRLLWDSEEQGLAKEENQGPSHGLRTEQQPRHGIPPVLNGLPVLAMPISTLLLVPCVLVSLLGASR